MSVMVLSNANAIIEDDRRSGLPSATLETIVTYHLTAQTRVRGEAECLVKHVLLVLTCLRNFVEYVVFQDHVTGTEGR